MAPKRRKKVSAGLKGRMASAGSKIRPAASHKTRRVWVIAPLANGRLRVRPISESLSRSRY
jgi:hypothetical protein